MNVCESSQESPIFRTLVKIHIEEAAVAGVWQGTTEISTVVESHSKEQTLRLSVILSV